MITSRCERLAARCVGLPLALLVAALLPMACNRATPKLAQTPPPEVVVDWPVMEEVTDYEEFTGRTEAIAAVEIRSRVSGYLEEASFEEGVEVAKGKQLFKIDESIYKATLEREDANVKQAHARLDRTIADFKRMEATLKDSLTPQERDKATADKAEAEAAHASAVATQKLADINYKYTRIFSPIDGRISRRLVDPGNLVKADETALTMIVTLDPIFVNFDVDERTLLKFRRLLQEGKIKSSRESPITVRVGVADEETYSLTGIINFVDNHVEPGTGTLRVRAEVKNPKLQRSAQQHFLSPGMFVRVQLPVGVAHKALVVPEEALGTDQGQKFVFVVNDKDEVEQRRVKVGALNNGKRVIETEPQPADRVNPTDRLDPNDRIIVSGQQRVRSGVKVTPKPAPKRDAPAQPVTPKGETPANGKPSAGL